MKVYRKDNSAQGGRIEIFNIMEATYTGKDMGERSITATIDFPSRIDFQPGDYVEFDIANLIRKNGVEGGHEKEKFYIYTMPTVKKIAKSKKNGKAFQHTVTFYPCQYELATVKMRDVVQDTDNSGVLYTGYDEFSFYGGANTLMKRIMAVLNERFGHTGVAGKDYWAYKIADGVNEDLNTALEQFQFDFSDNNVMEALLKLNDAEGVNTKFFINERMIYVGYKRPYITGVDEYNIQRTVPFEFMYGKTSHLPAHTNYGNLFTITKSNGSASPITRLFAKGSDRNLHRFYCSDRIKRGRYVNRLMLPSFSNDGQTDYIDSQEGIARFGIREGSKTFDKIYPSLRFFYYGDLRDVKYCIKIMGSGLESDANDVYDTGTLVSKSSLDAEQLEKLQASYDYAKEQIEEHSADPSTFSFSITMAGEAITMSYAQTGVLLGSGSVRIRKTSTETQNLYHYPIARIQCYRVVENTDPLRDEDGNIVYDGNNNPVPCGLNKLVESAPPTDLAVFCHATGKVVKCVLYADKDGYTSIERQAAADGKIPQRYNNNHELVNIEGSCFAVHDDDFGCGHTHGKYTDGSYDESGSPLTRADWFINPDTIETTTDDIRDPNKEKYKNEIELHQINYTDDHWITDIYEFTDYDQEVFNRQGYSAYCWPRVNRSYPESKADNIEVNAVVDVGPVYIEDTDINISQGQQQQTFDLYLRDVGFKINEQTWFGDRVFLFDTCKISFLDGNLAGYEFEMPNESDQEKLGSIYVPAITPDGKLNPEFFDMADNPAQAEEAFAKGAFWRLVVKRTDTGIDRYWMPNTMVNASAGNHIVFLDIFMPDIYVRVAENRLLKEAQKYLDANDDGDIQYSFDMDQVRPNEQPIFALQMREGAIMRVVDDDLDVGTINEQKTLFEDKNGLVSAKSMIKTTTSVDTDVEIITRDCDYIESKGIDQAVYGVTSGDNPRTYLTFKKSSEDSSYNFDLESGLTIRLYSPAKVQRQEGGGSVVLEWYCWNYKVVPSQIVSDGVNGYRAYIDNLLSLDGHAERIPDSGSKVYVGYSIRKATHTKDYNESILPVGSQVFCPANNLTDFNANKYYEVVIDAMEPDMVVADTNSQRKMFALVNGLGDAEKFYYPEYIATDITPSGESYKRYRLAFSLPEDFNENQDYYPAILYASDGETEAVHVRLWSIIERDDEALEDLNYVDLGIDTVTINFHDNTRETGVSLQDGTEPERLIGHDTEMIYKITATVKEESRATAWAQLMERVEDAEMVEEQNNALYQSIVEAARKYRVELMNLRNNIFDPDGTCKDTFLQIMMLQVGADSMNYQLRYTHYSITGQRTNCGIRQTTPSEQGGDKFYIGNADERLDHFVFTDAPTYGTWYPDKNLEFPLTKETGATEWPTYFVSLKCSAASSDNCHWECGTTQRKVNEESGYYYFNWGILVPDKYGHYTLTETRGNAYMYGDNLICGKISTLARNSWFDLTKGEFVLGESEDHSTATLSYKNGVLTIGGITEEGSLSEVLNQLGVYIDDIEGDVSTLQTDLDLIYLGGRNLLRDTAFTKKGENLRGWSFYGSSSSNCTRQTHADDAENIAENVAKIVLASGSRVQLQQTAAKGYNKKGEYYTFSAKMKTTEYAKTIVFRAGYGVSTTTATVNVGSDDNDWTDVKITCKVTSTGNPESSTYKLFYLFIENEAEGTLLIKEAMLEKGKTASPWTVAPEDTIADVKENEKYIGEVKQDLQDQIDGVVDSYFMEGIPTMDDEKKPLSDWKAESDPIDYAKHKGDTYTNIRNFGDELKPEEWEQGWIYTTSGYSGKTLDDIKSISSDSNHSKGVRFSRLIQYKAGDSLWVNPGNANRTVIVAYFDSQGKLADSESYTGIAYPNGGEIVLDATYSRCNVSIRSTSSITTSIVPSLGMCINPKAGHSWRFCNSEGTGWHWHEIADSDAVKALQDAAKAQDTADGKRRVFIVTRNQDDTALPTPPYDPGDLWANAYYQDPNYPTDRNKFLYKNVLLKCKSNCGKTAGETPLISDWEDSSRAISAADAAQADATEALNELGNIAADGVITVQEKLGIKREWLEAKVEYDQNIAQADIPEYASRVATEAENLTSKYNALAEYLVGKAASGGQDATTGIIGSGGEVTTAQMSVDTTESFTVSELTTKFKDFYDANVELLNAISNAILASANAEAESYVAALKTELQPQIDGVVQSYFMDGVPTLDNAPADDWKRYDEHGDLDPTETNKERAKHVGDTYTNIQNYTKLDSNMWELGAIGVGSGDYTGKTYSECKYAHNSRIRTKNLITNQPGQILLVPSSYSIMVSKFGSDGKYLGSYVTYSANGALPSPADGLTQIALQLVIPNGVMQSVELANELGLCINPDAGKSWRFIDSGTSQSPNYEWSEIADSDAVKALQDAAKAQDTADGKRRVFLEQPVPPYDEGDLWANAVYPANTGATYNNVLLKCKINCSRRADESFSINDWEDSSRAISTADAAQATVDRVTNDKIISGGTEKQTLNREFIEIAGTSRDGAGTDGSYAKAKTYAELYEVSSTDLEAAFNALLYAMKIVLGTNSSTGAIDGSNIPYDTYIGAQYNGSDKYDIIVYSSPIYRANSLTVNGTVSTGITLTNNQDYVLTVGSMRTEHGLAILGGTTALGLLMPNETSIYIVGNQQELKFVSANEEINIRQIQCKPIEFITTAKFNALWKNYYDAETAILSAVSSVIDGRAIGGENLLFVNNINEGFSSSQDQYELITKEVTYYSVENEIRTHTFLPAGKYVFSAKSIGYGIQDQSDSWIVKVYLRAYNSSSTKVTEVELSSTQTIYKLTLSAQCYFRIEAEFTNTQGVQGDNGYVNIQEMQLQKGDKATAYQAYIKHITEALHGTTEIAGGLVMTNLLMLKDEDNHVVAGMSGKTDTGTIEGNESEGVTLWGGGTYEQALKQAAGLVTQMQELIPILLTKTGVGSKIGCFKVDSHNQVSVTSANGDKIVINAGSSNSGPYIDFFKGSELSVRITSDSVNVTDTDVVDVVTKGTLSYKLIVGYNDNPNATAPEVEIDSIDISKKAKYNISYTNANWLKIGYSYKYDLYTSYINNVLIKFDVYIGEKRVGSFSKTYTSISGSTQATTGTYYLNFNSLGSTIAGGNYAVTIRNARAYGTRPDGTLHCLNLSITQITIGNGTVSSGQMTNWVNGKITFTNASVSNILIGNNGMKIENAYGGYFCVLNDKQNTYFRVNGLPTSVSDLDQSQLWIDKNGFLRVNGVGTANDTVLRLDTLGITDVYLPSRVHINMPDKHDLPGTDPYYPNEDNLLVRDNPTDQIRIVQVTRPKQS